MQDIINNITSSALFKVTLSIFAYVFGVMANKKLKTPIANPVLIADIIIVTILLALNIPYENYAVGGSFIELFLAPVTAALAVKIHAQIKELKAELAAADYRNGCRVAGFYIMCSVYVPFIWV